MKVGILTFHNAINYGAVLQAYALQQTVVALGAECEIIDYRCPAVEKQYRRKKIKECANWKVYVNDILSLHRLDKKKEAFRKFQFQNLILSERTENISETVSEKYDVIIVGSDQVFNPKNTDGDSAYLLNFNGKAKKTAYAASIGNNAFLNLWQEKYGIDYKMLLGKFAAMSFREKEAADFATQLLGQTYRTVLDPVLLAGNPLWNRFVRPAPEEEYVFVYNLGNIPLLVDAVLKVQEKTGLKVYVANKDIKGDFLFRQYQDISSASPEEFLKRLSNARYVLTDSFHGTAFSILFHKNFYSVGNPGKDNANSRLRCLLSELGLENRMISSVDGVDFDAISDYEEVDRKIQAMRDDSLAWLKTALDL